MIINSKKIMSFALFMLLYYIYFNSMRKILIPYSSITIPLILILFVIITFFCFKGKIIFSGKSDKLLVLSWILIYLYILMNNVSISETFIKGGIIQLGTMIFFMICLSKSNEWTKTWLKYTKIFVLIHAISTIVFYFNSDLYTKYIYSVFSGETIRNCLNYYKHGYMSGLCSHFSSNGMILSIGLIVFFEDVLRLKKTNNLKMKNIESILSLIILYALILSSKRSLAIASILGIAITYIIRQRKAILKNIVILLVSMIAMFGAYKYLIPSIPGLSTLEEKTDKLMESDSGLLNGRVGLWERAIDMYNKNPLFGLGYGSYGDYADDTNAISRTAHNYYLQILSELGIVGLILYITVFISAFIVAIRALIKSLNDSFEDEIYVSLVAADIEILVLIYSITSSALMYYVIMIPYFLSIAATRFQLQKGDEAI